MKKMYKTLIAAFTFLLFFSAVHAQQPSIGQGRGVWSAQQANTWYAKQGWLVGANYLPWNAINELEMWQAETFDTATIAKEFKWAASIGMNTMRIFLHDLAYKQDP
ncbi:MAG: 1,4-beta-xylanase, partial [Segetibacter sp.]